MTDPTKWNTIIFIATLSLAIVVIYSVWNTTKSATSLLLVVSLWGIVLVFYGVESWKELQPPKFKTQLEIEKWETKQQKKQEKIQYAKTIFPELNSKPFVKQTLMCRLSFHHLASNGIIHVCVRCGEVFIFPYYTGYSLGFSDPNIRLSERQTKKEGN